MSKKDFMENLRICFPDKNEVTILEISTWVGKKSALRAYFESNKNKTLVLRGGK